MSFLKCTLPKYQMPALGIPPWPRASLGYGGLSEVGVDSKPG